MDGYTADARGVALARRLQHPDVEHSPPNPDPLENGMFTRPRHWLIALAACGLLLGPGTGAVWADDEDDDEDDDRQEERRSRGQDDDGKGDDDSRGAPPPPPPVVFRREPEVILIPKTRVYFVPDQKYDLFRYGRHWYINNGGHWYRARAYTGPFTPLSYERVPATIVRLPEKYRRQPLVPEGRRSGRD